MATMPQRDYDVDQALAKSRELVKMMVGEACPMSVTMVAYSSSSAYGCKTLTDAKTDDIGELARLYASLLVNIHCSIKGLTGSIAKQVGPDVAEEFVNKIMKIVEEAKNQPDKLSQVTVVKKEPGVEFN